MPISTVDGLVSGLNTTDLITKLMSLEKQPQDNLKLKQSKVQNIISIYQALNTKYLAFQTAAKTLNSALGWKVNTATSSIPSEVTATASSTASTGSLSFVVNSLAQAEAITSFGSVSSMDTVVATGPLLIAKAGSIGIGDLQGNGLSLGDHTIQVTQASAGATQNGSPVSDSTTLASGATLDVTINGTAQTLNLNAGTYTQRELAAEVQRASGGQLTATVNADKSLSITTVNEGSAANLQINGGTAASALGLASGSVSNGVNGVISVDGTSNTVTDVRPGSGQFTTLNASTGTVAVDFSGGLRLGTVTAKNLDVGDGKLSSVTTAINNANMGISATAVQVSASAFKLQLQSSTTGLVGGIGLDSRVLASALGTMDTTTAASDAILTVGTGTSAYQITSSTNTASSILPGVTLTLLAADPTKTVTVNVGRDPNALADNVQKLVDSVNDALSYMKSQTSYDTVKKVGGPLMGDSTVDRLKQGIIDAVTTAVTGSSLGNASNVGISLNQDGSLSFDRSKFLDQYAKDPDAVSKVFVQGGTSGVSDGTTPGIAERLATLADNATNIATGQITTIINGRTTESSRLDAQIADWDNRLAVRQAQLEKIYSNLEVQLGRLKDQGNSLASQLGLTSSSSSGS